MFFRSKKVKKNVQLLSEECDIPFSKRSKHIYVWCQDKYKYIIIDCQDTTYHHCVVGNINRLLSDSYNSYVIVLANMIKEPLPNIKRIFNAFADLDEANDVICIYNHNANLDVYKLVEELFNRSIQTCSFYGPIRKKFKCRLVFNSYGHVPQVPLPNYRPDGSSMCGRTSNLTFLSLFLL